MESYKKQIRWRMGALVVAIVSAVTLVAVILGFVQKGMQTSPDNHWLGFSYGAATGIFAAMLVLGVMQLVRYAQALRDEARLQKMYVQENDERARLIQQKAYNATSAVSLWALLLAFVVTALLGQTQVALTLLAVCGGMALLKSGALMYYKKKY